MSSVGYARQDPPRGWRRTRRRQPERAVERACDSALALTGWWVIPVKNRAVPIRATGWTRWHFTGLKGIPDRFCVRIRAPHGSHYEVGTVVAIEYKAAAGRLSAHQVAFRQKWEGAGLNYLVVHGIPDLQKAGLDR